MHFIGNIIWLIFGGFFAAIGYVTGGIALCVTIIGIPFGIQCFKMAVFVLWPFGSRIVTSNSSGGCLQTLGNVIWLVFGGIWIALSHLFFGILLCLTIIGIPFGKKHFELIELSLMPFGKRIVNA